MVISGQRLSVPEGDNPAVVCADERDFIRWIAGSSPVTDNPECVAGAHQIGEGEANVER